VVRQVKPEQLAAIAFFVIGIPLAWLGRVHRADELARGQISLSRFLHAR
jgi:hypothetical protein